MSSKHPARTIHGKHSAGHLYPRPSDRAPVFMFGSFDLEPVGSTSVGARYKRSPGAKVRGGAMASSRRAGDEAATANENSAFMFGVHPE